MGKSGSVFKRCFVQERALQLKGLLKGGTKTGCVTGLETEPSKECNPSHHFLLDKRFLNISYYYCLNISWGKATPSWKHASTQRLPFLLKHITRPALGILPELILQSIFKCTVSIKLRFHYKWNITTRCHQNNDHPHLEETKNLLIHTITIHY